MTENSERRHQILDAAKRLFKHYGVGKTTVADIARAAGVGVGTVYLEFPSKDTLITELSAESYRCMLAAMRTALGTGDDHAARLRALLDHRLERFLDIARDGQHGMDLIRCGCGAVQEAHERFRAAEQDLLSEFLREACDDGAFATESPEGTARVLLRLYDCYAQDALAGGGGDALRAEIEHAHELVLSGLVSRDD
ncbi:TetR/AcrR family transcriptional regulator [Haliangium ochraceum]|uniref:Transcriptional regulator, TetR family n=1 Tax=Haliangium ochraceum (strain DSM 14365 / JCM 11303 / SMP-2) TaxID=502025 RepID=D0LQE7_HALO1|nr:TetR/AcrR family transcriptional regulator [Haliangium ochraceum]ACY18956.1 transcriptional regulator, TetR family [Haliangium ochraceum DSM 14365]